MSKGNFDAMGNLDESFMSRMASACPNLEVELKCTEQNSLTVLNVLGPLVRELSISLRLLRMTVSAKCSLLKSASVQCCNLESLDIFGWCGPESKVQTLQFFSLAKPRLRRLRLWMSLKVPLPEDGVSDVIEAVAENTGALESLHISSPRLEPHLLRTLAGANKQLEKIHFATRIDGVDVSAQKARYAEYMTEIIEAFSICPALKWVRLKTCLKKLFKFDRKIVAVEDACVRIRHRNIVVLLDKIPYCSTNRLGCARVRPISHAPPDSSDEGEQGELP